MLLRYGEDRQVRASGNLLFHSLSTAEQNLLTPHCEMVNLPRCAVVFNAEEKIQFLYFPLSGLVALEEGIGRHCHIEVAVVGREGLLGWPALLASERSTHHAVVQCKDMRALKIGLRPMLEACRASPPLWMKLLCFVQAIMAQMTCTITCHVERSVGQRVARWLLMRHDRLFGDHLLIHHDEIAEALCVRRASATDSLHIIEGERLIRCQRGRITIRDRFGLEAFAGAAYGNAEAHYREMIAPFGKSASIEAKGI